MPERFLLASALLALAGAAAAQQEPVGTEPMRIEGMLPWGTITRVMEPDYPRELKESKAKVHLDVWFDFEGERRR